MTVREAERRQRQRKATHAQRKITDDDEQPDVLVRDSVAAEELGDVTRMTMYRWDKDPRMLELGWPPRIEMNGRAYRSRRQLEQFKHNLMLRAIAARGGKAA